jgi:predicted nucleic acid-binding protein
MTAVVFVDTNVLLYSIDNDPASVAKRDRARQLLLTEPSGWSVQVAAEFFVNATSPKRPFRLAAVDAARFVENWLTYPTQAVTPDIVRAAIDYHQRFQLSYWDSAILAAAKALACQSVYSEDMNHGQDYDGVRVVNPFLAPSPAPGP